VSERASQHDSGGGSASGSNAASSPTTSTLSTQGYPTVPLDPETQPAPYALERLPPAAGQDIGPVRLLRELGRGAMGVVFLGHHKLLDRSVAVKFVSSASRTGSEGHARFFEEAKAAAAVRHPHLTEIYHADVAGDVPYLVLEYVDGPTLSQLLHSAGKLPLRIALSIVSEIAEAVGELHDQGIVHRDLKPSNVLLDRTGRVLVTDFGLAVRRDPVAGSGAVGHQAPAGTPAYMAPEMFEGRVSPRSDIYALGILMFQVLTGGVPFEGTFDELRQNHQSQPLPLEKLKEANVPDAVIEIIERATHKQLMFRYKTAHELGRAIVALGGDVAEIAKARSELRATILALRKGESAAAAAPSSSQGSSTRSMPGPAADSTDLTYADAIGRKAEAKRQRMQTLLGSESAQTGPSTNESPPPMLVPPAAPWSSYQPPPTAEVHDQKPVGAIMTACVIGIVLGAAGLLWCVIQGIFGAAPGGPTAATPPPRTLRTWQFIGMFVSLALSGTLITGAVVALALKEWGRRLLVRAAAANFAFQIVSLALAAFWAVPLLRQNLRGTGRDEPFVNAGGLLQVTSIPLLAVKSLIVCAAMATIVFLLTRRNVRDAFATPSPA
jgi:serine/threonine protein kinase